MSTERKLGFCQGSGTGRQAQVSGGGLSGGGVQAQEPRITVQEPGCGARLQRRREQGGSGKFGGKLHTKGATGGGASNTAGRPSKPALGNVLKNSCPTINSGI